MISVSQKRFWIECTYDEALLYCFQLKINNRLGWRLPTKKEWFDSDQVIGWYLEKNNVKFYNVNRIQLCCPVRDIL